MHRKNNIDMMLNKHVQKEQHSYDVNSRKNSIVMMLNKHAQKEQHSYDAEHTCTERTT